MESTDAVLAENSANEKLKKIHKHVSRIKASEEMGVKYMQKWEEKVLDIEKGREEGRILTEISVARFQFENKKPAEDTAKILKLSVNDIKKMEELFRAHPEETDIQIAARVLKKEI